MSFYRMTMTILISMYIVHRRIIKIIIMHEEPQIRLSNNALKILAPSFVFGRSSWALNE